MLRSLFLILCGVVLIFAGVVTLFWSVFAWLDFCVRHNVHGGIALGVPFAMLVAFLFLFGSIGALLSKEKHDDR